MSAMRSRRSFGSKALLILAFVCAISTSNAGQASHPPGRVVVKRVPQFGWNLAFNLQIDGRPVATIAKNHHYDGWLPAGRHVLTVYTASYVGLPQPTSTIVNVEPGRTQCVHRVVGFESDFSPPIRSVVDPRQAVGT